MNREFLISDYGSLTGHSSTKFDFPYLLLVRLLLDGHSSSQQEINSTIKQSYEGRFFHQFTNKPTSSGG